MTTSSGSNIVHFHTKGRLITGPNATAEDNMITFSGGGTALIKITEPISPMYNYFEIKILKKGNECAIGIGVGALNYPQGRMPGWNKESIGYHADDGHLYYERGIGSAFGPQCTEGDVIGCGIIFSEAAINGVVDIFFTKNGRQVGSCQKMHRPINGFYTLFGLHSFGEKICYLGHQRRILSDMIPLEPMVVNSSPSCYWYRSNGIAFVTDNGLTLAYAGSQNDQELPDIAVAQAIQSINTTNHYFEMTIITSSQDDGNITIGLAGKTAHCINQPGTYSNSIGYSVIQGKIRANGDTDVIEAVKCDIGDIIGCGVMFTEGHCNSYDYDSDYEPLPDDVLGTNGGLFHQPVFRFGDIFGLPNRIGFNHQLPAAVVLPPNKGQKKSSKHSASVLVKVYFTVNGKVVYEAETASPASGLYPTISLSSSNEKVAVDFNALSG